MDSIVANIILTIITVLVIMLFVVIVLFLLIEFAQLIILEIKDAIKKIRSWSMPDNNLVGSERTRLVKAAELLKRYCGFRPCDECMFYRNQCCSIKNNPVWWNIDGLLRTQEDTPEEND